MAASVTKLGRYQTKVDAAIRAVNRTTCGRTRRCATPEPSQTKGERGARGGHESGDARRELTGQLAGAQAELRPHQAGVGGVPLGVGEVPLGVGRLATQPNQELAVRVSRLESSPA